MPTFGTYLPLPYLLGLIPTRLVGAEPTLIALALVGMVAVVGEWWLDVGKPGRDAVAAHIVNLAWNGLSDLEKKPGLVKP